jgi:hypothetical protein
MLYIRFDESITPQMPSQILAHDPVIAVPLCGYCSGESCANRRAE